MEDKEIAYSNQLSKISLIENEIHSSTVASALRFSIKYY